MKSINQSEGQSEPLVVARGLTKLFGQQKAVDTIDFDIWPGEVVGFLGPNGAGKTTTIRMLLNLLNPSSGSLILFGMTFERSRKHILQKMNVSSGSVTLPGKLTVTQILKVFGDLYSLSNLQGRINDLLEKFDLTSLRDRPLYSLSSGQQVRVSMTKAFLNHPRLLLLDEPTASLDPDVADRVRSNLMDAVKSEKITVFLTSHNMKEVETVCSRVFFLNHGQIQAEGTPHELARRVKRLKLILRTSHPVKSLPTLGKFGNPTISFHHHDIEAEIDKEQVGPFLTELVKDGARLESVSIHEPSLEDFFVQTARLERQRKT